MRIACSTPEDISTLKSRQISMDASDDMVDVMHIYSTNKAVKRFNSLCFDQCHNEKYTITSVDKTIEKLSQSLLNQANDLLYLKDTIETLERDLEVSIDLIYELTVNLNIPDGLVNGAAGYLKYVQFTESLQRPIALWFEFEEQCIGENQRHVYRNYRNPNINVNWTPIFPYTVEFNIQTLDIAAHRTQFPVKQSSAKTIHKSQGSTVPKLVVCLKDYTFRNGCYVACSRVRELDDLHLVMFDEYQIKTDLVVENEMNRLWQERPLTLNHQFDYESNDKFKIFYHNCQSLHKHFKHMSKDFIVQECNIVLLNETHLLDTDSDIDFILPGYREYRFDTVPGINRQRQYNGLAIFVQDYFFVNVVKKKRNQRSEYMIIHVSFITYPQELVIT